MFGLTVRPLRSVPNSGRKNLLKTLRDTVRTLGIHRVVLGIPLNMDGTRGEAALRMERLREELEAGVGVPLTGIDERLSTVEAQELWQGMSPKRQKKYRTVDSLAAALILERYLKET